MNIVLPEQVTFIIETLQNNGFDAYAVGGCVRDCLLDKTPVDWDITTSATPEQIKSLFRRTVDTGIEHGTVTVMIQKEGYEVTTYRIDGQYLDSRHPTEVTFTPDLKEDLKRRDFTINAMAFNPTIGLVDEFEGLKDLKEKRIRCVGNPKERFKEDALRMMRAVRFGAQLGFEIEEATFNAMKEYAFSIEKVSVERVATELIKLLISPNPQQIRLLYEADITKVILPEFDCLMNTPQNNPHHSYNVGEHTIRALEESKADKVLRLALLFHDVSKPECLTTDKNSVAHFYGHQEIGAKKTREILKRLKLDNDTIKKVCDLIKVHDSIPRLTEKSIRKAMVESGLEVYPALFFMKRADVMAQSLYKREEKLTYINQYESLYEKIILQKDCLSLKELAVTGKDLIQVGIKPGPLIGERLQKLFALVIDDPQKNKKEILLPFALEEK